MEALSTPQTRVLEALADLQFATSVQLTRHAYSKGCYTSIASAAKALSEKHLIDRTHRMTQPMQFIYYLREKGRRYLEEYGTDHLPKVPRSIPHHWLFQEHILAVNDVLLAAREYGRLTGAPLDGFLTDLVLKREPFLVETPSGNGKYVPDAWFQLANRSFLLEVDRGTEEERFWRRKIQMIVAFSGKPVFERFGTRKFTVVVPIVPLDASKAGRRLGNLVTWTERELTKLGKREWGQIFLLAALDAAAYPPTDYFAQPVWRTPFDTTTHALIEPS
jgi:hypothetical protein